MYPQNAYNLITEIDTRKLDTLRQTLAEIAKDVEDNQHFNFLKITSIHFARFVILEEVRDASDKVIYPAYLAFETNYDGELEDHLIQIVQKTSPNYGFDKVFSACKKFPVKSIITDEDRVNFLKTDSYYHPYFYRGTWGRTVLQIRAEDQTRTDIQNYLDKNSLQKSTEEDIYKQVKQNVKSSPYKTAHPPRLANLLWVVIPVVLCFLYAIVYAFYYLMGALRDQSVVVFLPVFFHFLIIGIVAAFVLAVVVFFILLRGKEKTDKELDILYDPNPDTVSLRTAEDRIVQNQLTHLVELKEGSFRRFSLKMVLFLVETLGIYKFNKGELGGIPSIHFARWIIIDKGKRLLFYSNFDGSWENYLGDFIDRAAVGLTAVWSNTKLFPKSRNLIFEGATDEQKFKSWTRMHQIPTQVWYSAYKYLTVENINNNTAIQEGLKKEKMTPQELKDWLIKL